MSKSDYVTPLLSGLIFLVIFWYFSKPISLILENTNLSTELFTFSSLLFGLILTSYSILFGIIPNMREDLKQSNTMKDINLYFKICLLVLLLSIVFSLAYMFVPEYWMFLIIITFIGIDIGFFGYIIFLINDIFTFVSSQKTKNNQ